VSGRELAGGELASGKPKGKKKKEKAIELGLEMV